MTKTELRQNIGKIIAKDNKEYIWLFKLVDVPKGKRDLVVTQGIDVFPTPKTYHIDLFKEHKFIDNFEEVYDYQAKLIRLPTKDELNLYRKYTRELILLGTNKSQFGTK